MLTLVAIILVVVVVRRKVTYKQKERSKMEQRLSPFFSNALVAKPDNEMEEKGLSAGHIYVNEGIGVSEIDSKVPNKIVMKQAPKESSTLVSVTNIGDLYAVVDKSQKKGAEKEKETVTNKEDLYAMPMKKKGKLSERGEGVVDSGGVENGGEYDDMAGVMYEPKADSESVQQIEGDSKAPNVVVLYAVVDKSHKKKQ